MMERKWLSGGTRILVLPTESPFWWLSPSEGRRLKLGEDLWEEYRLAVWAGRQAEIEAELEWRWLEEATRP